MRVRRVVILAALCVSLFAAPVGAKPSPEADPRLLRKVTLTGLRVYLGEALARISGETGVALTVSDRRGPWSGLELVVYVKERPLHEVMAGLEALLETPYDDWHWRERGEGDGRAYSLDHRRTPEQAVAAASEDRQAEFERNCLAVYRAARAGPRALRELQALRPGTTPGYRDAGWSQFGLLGELNGGQFEGLMGGGTLTIPARNLSFQGQRYVRGAMAALPGFPDPLTHPEGTIRFAVQPNDDGTPRLHVDINTTMHFKAAGLGPSAEWKRRARRGWSNSGTPEHAREGQRIFAQMDANGHGRGGPTLAVQELLRRTAERHGIHLIAEVKNGFIGGIDPDWLLEEVLLMLSGGELPHKKLENLYLFRRSDAWYLPRDRLVPWPDIRALRETAEKNDGYLDLDALARVARLPPAQGEGLHEEFPDADPERFEPWRPELLLAGSLKPPLRQRLLSPDGLPLRGLDPNTLAILFPREGNPVWPGFDLAAANPGPARVSLREEPSERDRALVWTVSAREATASEHRYRLSPRVPLKVGEYRAPRRPPGVPPARPPSPRR